MTLFATLAILFFGLFMVRPLLKIILVPRSIIMPVIFVLCTVGSFSIASRLFDVWIMLGVGLCGFVLRKLGYPMAPFVLGLVLGDIVDKSLRRGLVLSDGSLAPFFTRPISAVIFAIVLFTVLMYVPAFNRMMRNAWGLIWKGGGKAA